MRIVSPGKSGVSAFCRRTDLAEARCDVIARIGMIEMRDLREACQTAFLDAREAIA
jgi:hypothetical protein